VHSIDYQKFEEIVSRKGLQATTRVKEEARSAIDNYFFRRYGLLVSVIIMSMLAFALFLYIKNIERKK